MRLPFCTLAVAAVLSFALTPPSQAADLKQVPVEAGIVAVVGLPDDGAAGLIDFAKSNRLTIYFQSDDPQDVQDVREAADEAGLLGTRLFAEVGPADAIHLADNLADHVAANTEIADREVLRVLRPLATANVGGRELVKPIPDGIDEWSHPYHGPDNNPQSEDKLVRGAFRTQFIAAPKFSPMPEQTVIAGGRIYKAMGHIAHKANQNEMLNTLLCVNAYNGTVLWKRPLPDGFMLHRNTMIATDDTLLMGDDKSCKVIDGKTGKTIDEITIDPEITDGPTWKWMAKRGDTLFALIGHTEVRVDTQKSNTPGLGHWPWGMWKGHDYENPEKAFGFGRTLVAIDLKSKEKIWHFRESDYLDARALCMSGDNIFAYSPTKFLACIGAKDGSLKWKNTDKDLLEAIAPNGRAQHYITGYATTCYMKSSDDYLFFAGPQRPKMVVASAKDGSLAWTYPVGNLQLVLRDDAIWAAGPQDGQNGVRLDYATGKVLAKFPARRACTRATGCADSIFYRASGGTVRVMTDSNTATHIDPMRPPCQDGVLVSNGHLYWGPWMCGCELSLYGNICLGPKSGGPPVADYADALVTHADAGTVEPLAARAGDWATYRGDNARSDVSTVSLPDGVKLLWEAKACENELPTAPVTAGGLVFVADRTGAVRAFDSAGDPVWKSYVGGPVYYPPTVANDRVYVGAADGRVYAFEARSGRPLWNFRVAPEERRIPVFGKLISAWPVAGGVVVQDHTVYAAAGITHYDGTYVVALDAVTGELKAKNTDSGELETEVGNGISLQGDLKIVDGELRFLAGGVYEWARYDLKTLECLNEPVKQVHSQYRTAFYPYYPEYGKYVSLDHTCGNGCTLNHDASYEGSKFTNLVLREPLAPGAKRPQVEEARWSFQRGYVPPKAIWQDTQSRRFTSFVVGEDRFLATGHPESDPEVTFLTAVNVKDGSDAWTVKTPGEVVKGGIAVGHDGRLYVSLEDGRVLCYGAAKKP